MPSVAAQPYDYTFPADGVALVLIDMQRDFVEPGGFGAALGNDVTLLQRIVPTVKRLLDGFRRARLPVIHTQEGHVPSLVDCPPSKRARGRGKTTIGDPGPMGRILVLGEPGCDFVGELRPAPGEIVLPKPGKGAFYGTDLDGILRRMKITHLMLGGVTTEVCVQTTMREANDRGYECLLIEDATESYFPEFKRATLEMVRAQGGIVGWTSTTEYVLASLAPLSPRADANTAVAKGLKAAPAVLRKLNAGPVRFDDLAWMPFRNGIEIFPILDANGAGQCASALLRYKPGANVAAHVHLGCEHIFVLDGSQSDGHNTYSAGDLLASPPGTTHSITSVTGCVVMAIWEKPISFELIGAARIEK